nr:folylpolyglutamate synthase/dihydrofolate synthase family protein [uncultured Flavobacterium sp.]
MTYTETLNWMFNQLPMYQKIGSTAYKKDLTNTLALAEYLNHPENKFKSIHIAGTNGKGSTSSMIASILQEAGYKVGLYTSPHLKDFRERIKINGIEISEEFVVNFINENKNFFEENQLSFFEMTVGLAFDYFAKQQVDVAIIEVGLGGRLDSTNIITPLLSIITNIGFDHVAILGDTYEKIAFEKAGIIKQDTPVVIGQYIPETKPVFINKAKETNSEIIFASDLILPEVESDLKGNYQFHNKKTVQASIGVLRSFFTISEQDEINGFKKVIKNTNLQGRWQILNKKPLIVADTAHNKDGLKIVTEQIFQQEFENLYIVFGVVNDKDLAEILTLIPKKATYFIAKPDVPRGLEVEVLAEQMKINGFNYVICNSIPEAFAKAKNIAKPDDMIYVGGSTFVVAEVL